jgi:ArsR family transcriptional regulator, arsenate/arsenite/antimonite-responsive transcriptional repressor
MTRPARSFLPIAACSKGTSRSYSRRPHHLDSLDRRSYASTTIEAINDLVKGKMIVINESDLLEITTFLKALAEPNRLRIFAELMAGDSCNCELQERLDLAPNLLSHHLRVLSQAGLVDSRRDVVDGRWIYYSVNRGATARWQQWFNTFLDPSGISERVVCGPEGQLVRTDQRVLGIAG